MTHLEKRNIPKLPQINKNSLGVVESPNETSPTEVDLNLVGVITLSREEMGEYLATLNLQNSWWSSLQKLRTLEMVIVTPDNREWVGWLDENRVQRPERPVESAVFRFIPTDDDPEILELPQNGQIIFGVFEIEAEN